MIHEHITEKIINSCFEVSNELGSGFLESVYRNALVIALTASGLKAEPEVKIQVIYKNVVVGNFCADIIVEGNVVVELKAVKSLLPEHTAQTLNYLKATGIPVGLLVNFGNPRLEYHRLENRF